MPPRVKMPTRVKKPVPSPVRQSARLQAKKIKEIKSQIQTVKRLLGG